MATRLAYVGDFTLGDEYRRWAMSQSDPSDRPFAEVVPVLRSSDLTVVNLEGPICAAAEPSEHATVPLRSPVEALPILQSFGRTVANLANNHVMDFGDSGLRQTWSHLESIQVVSSGAGLSFESAHTPAVVAVQGRSIGFLGLTTDAREVRARLAGPGQAGCGALGPAEPLARVLASARKQCDFLCVSVHWGREFFEYPAPEQRDLARWIVDQGANLVVGHHAHVVQGIEWYAGVPICYSVGNFFAPPVRMRNGRVRYQFADEREFAVWEVEIEGDRVVEARLRGGKRGADYRMRWYEGRAAVAFAERMKRRSEPLVAQDYRRFWGRYCGKRERYLKWAHRWGMVVRLCRSPREYLGGANGWRAPDVRRRG